MLGVKTEEKKSSGIFDKITSGIGDYLSSISDTYKTNRVLFKMLSEFGISFGKDLLNQILTSFTTGDYESVLSQDMLDKLQGHAIKFLNKFITNSPFEFHPPNSNGTELLKPGIFGNYKAYDYLGPGTQFEKRYYELKQTGINHLDEGAKEHDKAYFESEKLPQEEKDQIRKEADKKLMKKAFDCILKPRSLNEFIFSVLTYIGMRYKIKKDYK